MVRTRAAVGSSSKVWIGSTVLACLSLVFGSGMIISGSLIGWRADRVLGLYGVTGWNFRNLTSGDGRVTLVAGAVFGLLMVAGLLLQSRYTYALATFTATLVLGLAVYEIIHIATRPGITGIASGLYLVLGGSVTGLMCALSSYVMMSERGMESPDAGGAAAEAL